MQVMRHGDTLYVGHAGTTGAGTSILDVSAPDRPELVTQWDAPANTHTHKVQIADGLLLVNHERFPYRPEEAVGAALGRRRDLPARRSVRAEADRVLGIRRQGRPPHRLGGRTLRPHVGYASGIHRPHLDDHRPGRARTTRARRALVVAGTVDRRGRDRRLGRRSSGRGAPRADRGRAHLPGLRRREPGRARHVRSDHPSRGVTPAVGRRGDPHVHAPGGSRTARRHRRTTTRRPARRGATDTPDRHRGPVGASIPADAARA